MGVLKLTGSMLSTSVLLLGLAHSNQTTNFSSTFQRLSLSGSLGYLNGESREYVYDTDTGHKLSQLNWHISGNAVLGGEANVAIFRWLDANINAWSTLDNGAAVMDDYDWMVPNQTSWTDWSHHNDTDLRHANEYDLNLRAWFLQRPNYKIAGILGYQRTLFSFLAKGGCFNYSNGAFVGCFPDGEIGIGYQQIFSTPYIGIAGKYFTPLFEFNGLFKVSNSVHAKDTDQHYQRDLTFRESGDDFNFYQAMVSVGYHVKPQVQLFMQGTFEYYPNDPASTFIVDNTTGNSAFLPTGSAGLENKNYIVSLGIKYSGDGVQVQQIAGK